MEALPLVLRVFDSLSPPEDLAEVALVSLPEGADVAGVTPPPGSNDAEVAMAMAVGPNPFRATLGVRLTLARSGETVVEVLDVSGRLVQRLHAGALEAGSTSLVWDGRDASGRRAPSGLYLVRVRQGSSETSEKVLRLR